MPAQNYSQCLKKVDKISKALVQMHMLICLYVVGFKVLIDNNDKSQKHARTLCIGYLICLRFKDLSYYELIVYHSGSVNKDPMSLLKYCTISHPACSIRPLSAHQRNAIQMAFRCRTDHCPDHCPLLYGLYYWDISASN